MSCSANEKQVNNLCYSCPENTTMIQNMCYSPCPASCTPSTTDPTKCVSAGNLKCDVRQASLPNVRPLSTSAVPTITTVSNCPSDYPNLINNKCYANCNVSDYSPDYCVSDSGYTVRPYVSLK